MAALNCTVASGPAREYVLVLTNANARAGKRGDDGGEEDSKLLGAYDRDKLNENGKLLLGFAEDKKLALLNTFFCTLKSGVSYTFQSANRSIRQARLDYILAKQTDRRLIRCVNVRRPRFEALESVHNLVRESPHPTQVHNNREEEGPHVAKGSGSAARRALTCRRVVVVECWVLVDACVGGLVYSHISQFCSENIRLISSQQLYQQYSVL